MAKDSKYAIRCADSCYFFGDAVSFKDWLWTFTPVSIVNDIVVAKSSFFKKSCFSLGNKAYRFGFECFVCKKDFWVPLFFHSDGEWRFKCL